MRSLSAAIAIGIAANAGAAYAGDAGQERFWIQAGVYYPAIDTTIRVQAPNVANTATTIDFERDLAFKDRAALPSVMAGMRLGKDWRVVGEFYRLGRSREASLATAIVFDGVTYPVNASVTGSFSSDVYRLSVGYSFINKPKIEVGAALGAHLTDFSVGLAGTGNVGTAAASFQERRRRLFAPLPTVGLHAEWRPAPRVRLATRVDFLSLKIDDYDGRLINAQASAAYEVTRGLDLGLMWRQVDYRLGVSKPDWSGQVNYRFSGPMAFVEYRFGG
ncbi:MAG: hypothetical protein ACKVOP_03695 [Sphingomonadaceae bacterium]